MSININNYLFSYDQTLKNKLKEEIKDFSQNNGTIILNKNKDTFSLLEKYVYDLIKFYCKVNNIDFDNLIIEFWCKSKIKNTNLHVDCDEELKKENIYEYPLRSFVSYFNNNDCPTIITNIERNKYIYKDFKEENNQILFSLPKENKILIFDGSYYHGVNYNDEKNKEDERLLVAVNIWIKEPTNINYYSVNGKYLVNEDIFTFLNKTMVEENIVNNILNYNLMNSILYEGMNIYPILKRYINFNNNCSNYLLKNNKKKDNNILLKNKYGKLMDDIHFIYNQKGFKISKVITPEIGSWIIKEAEDYASIYGWTTKRHNNYPTTDIPLKNIIQLNSFFNIFFENKIIKIIKESYNLHDDINFILSDIFIVKYNEKQQSFLEMHTDGSFLSINILLNSENEFQGGGTIFEDGLVMNTTQGDLLLHSSLIKHSGLQIYKGTRYVLVAFINLNLIP